MPVLDSFNRRIEPPARPETRELAVLRLSDRFGSYPSFGLTPTRLAAIFREADQGDVQRQAELFEEMEEKDAHLSGELLKRKNAVGGLDYDILPYDAPPESPGPRRRGISDRVSNFCREVLRGLGDFDEARFDLLDAIGQGFAACEIVWEIEAGRAVPARLVRIPPRRLTFVDSLVPRLLSGDDRKPLDIPAFKVVYHRHQARSGHDARAGLLRVCAWMYLFKNYAVKDWAAFAEVFGMPLRLGRYEPGAGADDKEALSEAIKSLGADAAGIISKNTEIQFIESQKQGSADVYRGLTDFCNREMSKAVIGATLTAEVGEHGSYAASKTHESVRLDLVRSDAWALSRTLRRQLLRPLVGFNFGWNTPVPWFRFFLEQPEDLKTLSEVYRNLAALGQPISAEHVSERFGVPLPRPGQTGLAGKPSRSAESQAYPDKGDDLT